MNCALIFMISTAIQTTTALGPTHGKAIICPVLTKSVYILSLPTGPFRIEEMDLEMCTHIVCIDSWWYEGKAPWLVTDKHRDSDYKQLTGLRAKYPHLKILLGIRRINKDYIKIITNEIIHREFIENATRFVMRYDFDGINLNWQNVGARGLKRHMAAFSSFLKALSNDLKKTNRLLTATYNILDLDDSNNQYDLSSLSEACDFIAVFYTFYFTSSRLDSFRDPTVLLRFSYFETAFKFTVDISNVVFGISFNFGKYVMNGSKYELSRKMSYHDFCNVSCSNNCEESFDSEIDLTTVRYRDELSQKNVIISFGSSRSIANQVRFAMKLGLGGVLTGAVNDDDFLGRCGLDTNTFEDFKASEEVIFNIPNRTNAKLPLLKTVNEAVILTLDEIQQQNDSLNNGNTSFSSRIISNVPLLLIGILMRCSTFHTTFWISTSN